MPAGVLPAGPDQLWGLPVAKAAEVGRIYVDPSES